MDASAKFFSILFQSLVLFNISSGAESGLVSTVSSLLLYCLIVFHLQGRDLIQVIPPNDSRIYRPQFKQKQEAPRHPGWPGPAAQGEAYLRASARCCFEAINAVDMVAPTD